MVHTNTSIFLFFLIIGTSVFPNGYSTGLAYARSGRMPGVGAFLDGMGSFRDIFQNIIPNPNSNQQSRGKTSQTIYGSLTNNNGYIIRNKTVGGSIYFGSKTVQIGNRYE